MSNQTLYELTSPQKNIYMREQFYKGTSINNLAFTMYYKKGINEKICVKALNKIVERNEGLRLRFKTVENEVKQYVEEFEYENFQIKQYGSKTFEDIQNEIDEDSVIPFLFENSKLYKFVIYKLKNGETVIYVKFHHIISDAWTGTTFCNRFNEYYRAFLGKKILNEKTKKYEKPEKVIEKEYPSYIKFLDNEKKYFQSSKFEKDRTYWEQNVENLPEAITFKEICSKKTSVAKRYKKVISISDEINEYCKNNNITQFTFFVAVYAIYLYKAQSKTEFTIGTPLLNRKNHIEKSMLGAFISTVPLIIRIDENKKIGKLIKSISTQLMGVLRHGSYPYSEIQKAVHNKNEASSNLFDTIISFQNAMISSDNVDGKYKVIWNPPGNQQSSFEFHITDHNDTGKYTFCLDYNENYCDEEEIKFVYDRLINISKQIINSNSTENITPKEINFLDKKETQLVVEKFNSLNNYEPSKPLINMFNEQVKRYPNNVAIKYKDKQLTYSELNDRVNIIANKLIENGLKGNVPVCILLDRSLEMIIAMLGALKAGAYYVTIDPFWPKDRVSYIMDDIRTDFVITQKKYENEHPNLKNIVVDEIDFDEQVDEVKADNKMTDYVYVIYTSGSTGKPKGTMMTNININNLLNSTDKLYNQNEKDIWTLFHTYTFDFSAFEIYGCLTKGGKLIIVPKDTTLNPKAMIDLLIKEKVTVLNQTTACFYKLLDAEKIQNRRLTKLRLVNVGGETVAAGPLKYWKEKYPNIVLNNVYGPTETTIFATCGEITNQDIENDSLPIGYPLENYKITMVNKWGEPLGIGLEGEMCITSKSVCSGYFNNKEMTKEKFIKTDEGMLYKTGDVAYWQLDGRIKYIGRNDNQVKIRGFRIELGEIEKELLACEGVSKAIVFPIENSNFTKTLIGFIETKKKNYTKDVIEQISKNLTSYMIPKLYQVETMPLNDNGKIDRKKLLASVADDNKNRKVVKPKNKLEEEIYDIISKDKKMTAISTTDDFFQDIGLDSLDVMKLATALSKYNVEIQKINNNPTIEKLASSISNNKKDVEYIDELYDIDIVDKKFKYNMSNVFITGATGFLGIHILKDLIFNNNVKQIYCLVRSKGNSKPENRIKKSLHSYFKEFDESWLNKITVLEGNFEEEFLGLDKNKYFEVKNNITTIIHCGANVKHYGKFESFYQTNVVGTENIIKLAYDSGAKLAHISTLSVGGFSKIGTDNLLTERNISVNQEFKNHVYMITKYEAECKVLDAIGKGWITAKIFRLGNIMPRLSDGVFQSNKYNNGFLARVQTIIDTKAIPKEYADLKFDLSPVDLCSKAIIKLMMASSSRTVLHIYNKNVIRIRRIFKKMNIEEVSIEDEIKRIKENDNPYDGHLLNDLVNWGYIETPVNCKLTTQELLKAGFLWNHITSRYIDKVLKNIEK